LVKHGRAFVHPTKANQWVAVAPCGSKENRHFITARVMFIRTETQPSWVVFKTRKKDHLTASEWAAPIDRCFCIER
jgi:hypothetical protein